jgi:transcription initiation factor TFIIIB Brf1 subunit/transcription initiation factor TFIIB
VTTTSPTEDRLPDAERVRNGTRLAGEYAVNRVADALQLPPGVREDADAFLHGALEAGACPDYAPETVGTAAAYAAIRRSERPWTRTEVVDAVDGDGSAVTGAYHGIVRAFGLCLNSPDPERFVARIVDGCDLPNAVERRALARLGATETHDSDSALGLAAAAVIVESDASPADVAELTPLSALALRSRYVPRFDER